MRFSKLFVACALVLTSTAWADTYRLVTFEYPPYEYSENGEVTGLAVDVVREAFKLMGHEASIEILPWARCQVLLERGEVDGLFTFFQTDARRAFTLFSKEVLVAQTISLWVQKDANVEFSGDLADLQPYIIGVTPKTSYGDRFDMAIKEGRLRAQVAPSIESNIRKLVSGRIDIWVSNRDGARRELKRLGMADMVRELKQPIQVVPAYVGFSKLRNHMALRDAFDQALITLKRTGVYDSIARKYVH